MDGMASLLFAINLTMMSNWGHVHQAKSWESQYLQSIMLGNAVWAWYIMVNTLQNTHKRTPHSLPWGQAIGCKLWVEIWIYIRMLPLSFFIYVIFCYINPRVLIIWHDYKINHWSLFDTSWQTVTLCHALVELVSQWLSAMELLQSGTKPSLWWCTH